jgi:quercetin dioxygenase-like cupin family protein
VWADPVLSPEAGVSVNNVFFEPGARTHWHTHEVTQVLHVVAGEGWVQVRGGPGGPITTGDTVHIPAGEEHWHGAGSASYVLHLAVTVGETEWLDEVSDGDYERAITNG